MTNFAGILSQGLRIAPSEAPATGYMFGKGVYFADLVSKSAQYCYTDKKSHVGLMLLSEVALGNVYELKKAKYMDKPPSGKHSTKGLGKKVLMNQNMQSGRVMSLFLVANQCHRVSRHLSSCTMSTLFIIMLKCRSKKVEQ